MITQREFEKVLVGNGYKNLLPHIKKELYEIFVERGYDFKTANAILNGARRMAILSNESQEIVMVDILDLFKNHCSKLDEIKYQKIDAVVRRFKEYYTKRKIKTPKIEKMIQEIYVAIKSRADSVNKDLAEFTEQDINRMFIVASIYNSINNYINAENGESRAADSIVGEKLTQAIVNNQNLAINEMLKENAEELMESLTSSSAFLPEDEIFSGEELKRLLKHTTSIIYTTDAAKATQARLILKNYIETLKLEIEHGTPEESFLNALTAKRLVIKSGSLLTAPESLKTGIDLVSGKTISESITPSGKGKKTQEQLVELFPGLKIEGFTAKKQAYLLSRSPSLLNELGGATALKSITSIVDGIAIGLYGMSPETSIEERIQKIKQNGFNVDGLLHADNLNELFNGDALKTATAKKRFGENLTILSKILSPSNIQKIIQHNINFLCQDPQVLKSNLDEIVKAANGDPHKLKDGLEEYVNAVILNSSGNSAGSIDGDYARVGNGFGLESDKEFIELDITLFNVPQEKFVITKDNYQDLLFIELSRLNAYLDHKIQNSTESFAGDSLAAFLSRFDKGSYEVRDKGGATRKLKQLSLLMKLLSEDKNPPEGIYFAIDSIKEKLASLDIVLDLSIEETTAIGDELVEDKSTREKIEGEILGEYEAELKRLETIKSKKLKAKYEENRPFIEERIEYIKKKIQEIHENKGIMHLAYAERAGYMLEQEFAKQIGAILGEAQQKSSNSSDVEISQDDVQKRREYDSLVDIFNNNMRKFNTIYKTQKAKQSSHAKRWLEKIASLAAKLEQMQEDLEK